MAKLRAAVLAAGRGVRMGGERPKCLIPIDDQEPLLHYIVEGLRRAQVDDLLVVTGFGAAEVQNFVIDRAGSLSCSFTRNARYASWGNFHSVRMALDLSPGADVLVVNSDVVVPPAVFDRVKSSSGELVLAVQRRRRVDSEDMRVELEGAIVRAIGKDIKMVRSHGEFCGVSLIRPPAARAYGDVANRLEWRADTSRYYEDVYAFLLASKDARAAWVEEGEYAEVDAPADVEDARSVIEAHRDEWEESP